MRRRVGEKAVGAAREGVSLAMRDFSGELRVSFDPDKMSQALNSLLENAAKFSRDGYVVEVGLEKPGDRALIRVIKQGPGMQPEQLELLFEPFRRVKGRFSAKARD